jgi:hypothetical protein
MAESPAASFRTVYVEQVRAQFTDWGRQAQAAGMLPAFLEALNTIDRRLRTDPLEWGEARNRLPHADLTVCCGFEARILIRYGVDPRRKIVYITACQLLPGHPLYSAS